MKLTALYLLTFLALWPIVPEAMCFSEHWRTFYLDVPYMAERLRQDGVAAVAGDVVTGLAFARWSVALMLAVPAALAAWAMSLAADRWLRKAWTRRAAMALILAAAVGTTWAVACRRPALMGSEGRFRTQMCQARRGDWQAIIDAAEGRRVANLLEQNLLNLALAETGQLDARLMEQPCRNILSLYVQQYESPYVVAMLSDIYWSMGHVALAQQYAFQANQKLGNHAPRLLQRLADAAIVGGHYDLARHYLWWLVRSPRYRRWAQGRLDLIAQGDAAVERHPTLGDLRRCIPHVDRFSASHGLDTDLRDILGQNPGRQTTRQYLNALCRLYYGLPADSVPRRTLGDGQRAESESHPPIY